ncbi:hypothetical protein ACIRD9_42610 [Streptomyces violaceus]|uniref:hypothetical protein n=1 Tax=Streptomyces violaceus TaxID=1936 RepID=UPI003821EB33
MGWTNDQFVGELTIPEGATTGQRITINVGNDGAIKVYDSTGTLVAEISPTADVIKALNALGVFAKLDPSAPSGVADQPGPGLALGGMAGDVEPGSLTEFDDTFSRGLYLRTSSPVADPDALEGVDYAAIRMLGRFHGSDPSIQLLAGSDPDAPDGFVALNGIIVDANSRIISYGEPEEYTPELGNDGTAAYSTRRGWFYRIGPMVYMNAYFVLSGAGSGASNLTLIAPTGIDRTNRQYVGCHAEAMTAGNSGSLTAVGFTSGSGDVFDRVRSSTGANITGADLTATAILAFEGWYREG